MTTDQYFDKLSGAIGHIVAKRVMKLHVYDKDSNELSPERAELYRNAMVAWYEANACMHVRDEDKPGGQVAPSVENSARDMLKCQRLEATDPKWP